MTSERFSILARLRSFRYAIQGLVFVLRSQHNAQVHLAATIAVIALALWLHVSTQDWLWLVLALALVWITETFNTAFEFLCDVVSPHQNMNVAKAKDIAAGAVLIAAIAAAGIGLTIFLPYLF